MNDTVSKHPFFLYALKECLVNSVKDDFSLRHQLTSFSDDWVSFERKVLFCCDKVLRPFASTSGSISSRLLMTHGKGATLNPSIMTSQTKRAIAFMTKINPDLAKIKKKNGKKRYRVLPVVTHKEWCEAHTQDQKAKLIQKTICNTIHPYHSIPLPKRIKKSQCKTHSDTCIYTCPHCSNGYFVGWSLGKKMEALGCAITKM